MSLDHEHFPGERCDVCEGRKSIGDILANAMSIVERGEVGFVGTTNEAGLPFTYTYGLAPDHAELLITGTTPELAHKVLTDLVALARAGDLPADGEPFDPFGTGYPFVLRDAGQPGSEMAVFARRTRGVDFAAVRQVVWPDTEGRYPWDEGSDHPAQFVL